MIIKYIECYKHTSMIINHSILSELRKFRNYYTHLKEMSIVHQYTKITCVDKTLSEIVCHQYRRHIHGPSDLWMYITCLHCVRFPFPHLNSQLLRKFPENYFIKNNDKMICKWSNPNYKQIFCYRVSFTL